MIPKGSGHMLIIRPAERKDISEAAEIEMVSFSDPWTAEGLEAELDNPMGIFLAAEDRVSGRTVGFIIGTADENEGYIEKIAVRPDERRNGTGAALLRAFIERVPMTAEHISLEVRVSNTPAVRLYESFGFECAGVRKKFYSSPTEDAFVMIMRKG